MKLPDTGERSAPSDAATTRAGPALADAPLRGEAALRLLERGLRALDAGIGRLLPARWNPLLQAGAIANTAFFVAVITGVALLLWYRPSVHQAYASVEGMGARTVAGVVRSLHRYSSDGCMLFVLIHALRIVAARRFTGARWLAWVTGLALLALLWLVGWLGYWLVWDERGHAVALGTARLLDTLPVFVDPLSRGFLTDGGVNSLLFFVVFFVHMLLPLAMGVALWLHISRLARSRFLTDGTLTLWVVGSLLALALALPADLAAPARMAAPPRELVLDAWFLAPLLLTDRLGGGALWAAVLCGGAVALSLPWTLARGRARVAEVHVPSCNACQQCVKDCPYDAIRMVPRTDGRAGIALQAEVDASKCVGCGICTGSCDSMAIGIPWLGFRDERRRVERWVEALPAGAEAPRIAAVCAETAGRELTIDPASGACAELPGFRVLTVPCIGWVNANLVERALKKGAPAVLLAACPEEDGRFREGLRWTRERMTGERLPALSAGRQQGARVVSVRGRAELLAAAARLTAPPAPSEPGPRRRWAGALLAAALLGAATWALSVAPYSAPRSTAPTLVVSFKHPGQVSEVTRQLTEEEIARLLPHMRRKTVTTERRRAPVRLRVSIDGAVVLTRRFEPAGVWGDGNSVAVEELEVAPGARIVRVELGDSLDPEEWNHAAESALTFADGERRVILFDRVSGFSWH